jgi:chemotaxis signal transduction protein
VRGATFELLLFQVATQVYATRVGDVVRIGSAGEVPDEELLVETVLGTPFTKKRGIVVGVEDSEKILAVDQVLGVRTLPKEDLRPLPAFAAACLGSLAVSGLVLLDEVPMPLIDLKTLLHEGPGRAFKGPAPLAL